MAAKNEKMDDEGMVRLSDVGSETSFQHVP
jgi:hypothetical protein